MSFLTALQSLGLLPGGSPGGNPLSSMPRRPPQRPMGMAREDVGPPMNLAQPRMAPRVMPQPGIAPQVMPTSAGAPHVLPAADEPSPPSHGIGGLLDGFGDIMKPKPVAPGQERKGPFGGLDPEAVKLARWQMIGNMGNTLMALSQQMTPGQRAQMLSRADFTGGYMDSLKDFKEMQRTDMLDARDQQKWDREQAAFDEKDAMKAKLNETIKGLPPGRLRAAATFYFTSGDYAKAGELLWKREKVYDPMTGQYITVDGLGDPLGVEQGSDSYEGGAGGAPTPTGGSPGGAPAPTGGVSVPPAGADAGEMPPAPGAQAGGDVDPVTKHWRIRMQDPNLTPGEVRIITAAPSPEKALDAYRQIKSDRETVANNDRIAVKDMSEMANTIYDDWRTETELPQRVVDFSTSIEDTLASGDPVAMRALATQVLFAKVLDPGSAFMTGEADLQQAAASWKQRAETFVANTTEGTPLPRELILEMREISRTLARRAATKLRAIDKRAQSRAKEFKISPGMLGGEFPSRDYNFGDEQTTAPGREDSQAPAGMPRLSQTDAIARAEYALLPPGAVYIDPNGNVKTKGAPAPAGGN